ncbi:MAG: cellulose biosynthesis cyclic di-GMP-binding regulatory protein BcsB, partial [Chloroflexota bacterium]|nr:cellulose biosynthesis cyclic di-GMP-binding regulatory protein BcsB [Chloroflexota bacterium]
LSISQFPYGFADPHSYEGFAFSLPTSPDTATMMAMSQLAFSYGKALSGNPAMIQVIENADDPAAYQAFDYVVLLGEAEDVVSAKLNAQLPMPLDMETGLPADNNLILQADNTDGSLGYIEAFESGEGAIVLLVTGNDPQTLTEASTLLSSPGIRQTLEGSVAVVSSIETAAAYYPDGAGPVSLDQRGDEIMLTTPLEIGGQSIWILRVTAGILGISVIIMLIALLRKNRRGEES